MGTGGSKFNKIKVLREIVEFINSAISSYIVESGYSGYGNDNGRSYHLKNTSLPTKYKLEWNNKHYIISIEEEC